MIIVDVEIKKAILGRGETPIEGIEYCGGWRDFEGMGISCVCTYDIVSHLSRVFLEEDLNALAEYLHGKRTAGFNTKRFDIPLLAANGVTEFLPLTTRNHYESPPEQHYDMLEQIWLALGLNPDKFVPRTHGGWGLDAVCQATLGMSKTGTGALAPIWWQQGKRGKVIDYCLNDVWMEGQLLLHILKNGVITAFSKPNSVLVKLPENVRYIYEANPITGPLPYAVSSQERIAQLEGEIRQHLAEDEPPAAPAERSPGGTVGGLGIIR